eukprot:2835311-Pyramimonas_sp.AAC.1
MVHTTDMAALWRSLYMVLYGCALLLFKNISFANTDNKLHDVSVALIWCSPVAHGVGLDKASLQVVRVCA